MTKEVEIKGSCCGVKLEQRGPNDPHICITLMIEDDEHWHEKDFSVSSFWIDDLIDVLKQAKEMMKYDKRFKKDKDEKTGLTWGYKFK